MDAPRAEEALNLIDTHCHLNLADHFPDVGAVLRDASQAGVHRLIVVGIDGETNRSAVALAEEHEGVFATVGWHPNSAGAFRASDVAELRDQLAHPKVVALGEIGLDFHWDVATPAEQAAVLDAQLDLAAEVGCPIVFHCRKAYDELLAHLEARGPGPYLFHCFSGDAGQAARGLALGGMLGFDGPLTYKNASGTRQIAKDLPHDRFVLETDAPYLPPEPHRGKQNRPAFVALVNAAMASVRGISEEACAAISTANAERFFRLPTNVPVGM